MDYCNWKHCNLYGRLYNVNVKSVEYIEYSNNGLSILFDIENIKHNIRGPARIILYRDKPSYIIYWIMGKIHNSRGPAIITDIVEYYYINGEFQKLRYI